MRDEVMHTIPKQFPDPKATDAMLAREMNKLTVNERELAYEDLHGVAECIEETQELIDISIKRMKKELDNIHDKPAFMEALSKSPEYVGGRDLWLMFLRTTNFDAKAAASKVVLFFEHKKLYFNDNLLGKPIKYTDMDSNDLVSLKSGWLQVLPFRDSAQRPIIWILLSSEHTKQPTRVLLRTLWYVYAALAEDEQNQKRGVVLVLSGEHKYQFRQQEAYEGLWNASFFARYAPIRTAGAHFCVESRIMLPFVALSKLAQKNDSLARNRVHFGSQTEWMYALMTFGIPVTYAPVTSSGTIKTKSFRQWLAMREILETAKDHNMTLSHRTIIELPNKNDVLLGRGCLMQNFIGNLMFHQIVDKFSDQYKKAESKQAQADIAKEIWKLLEHEHNVRFLEQKQGGWWEEVVEEDIILKRILSRLKIIAKKPSSERNYNKNNELARTKRRNDYHDDTTTYGEPTAVSFFNHSGNINSGNGCCLPTKRYRE